MMTALLGAVEGNEGQLQKPNHLEFVIPVKTGIHLSFEEQDLVIAG